MSIHRHTGIQIQHTEGERNTIHSYSMLHTLHTHAHAHRHTHRTQNTETSAAAAAAALAWWWLWCSLQRQSGEDGCCFGGPTGEEQEEGGNLLLLCLGYSFLLFFFPSISTSSSLNSYSNVYIVRVEVVWRSLVGSGCLVGGRGRRGGGRRKRRRGCCGSLTCHLITSLQGLFALVLTAGTGRQNPLHKVFGPPSN